MIDTLFELDQALDLGNGESLPWRPRQGARLYSATTVGRLPTMERTRKDSWEIPDWGKSKIDGRLYFNTAGLAAMILHYTESEWDWLAWELVDEAMEIRAEAYGRQGGYLNDRTYGKMFSAFFSWPYQEYERGLCG
ncbi:hypothetical protein [Streptomyces sp. 769]|uniref:hypothetical protein n=1 Tax=Streptomyces sp. 769 TaxID=1262452 RepID=UPI00057DDE76|nr:hypothetical protein [Streptomyces sp. 769]AJC53981.1 hypothetical protein GZL_01381 [Streptomyces sp. 769]